MKALNQDRTTVYNCPMATNPCNTVILTPQEFQASQAYSVAADTKVMVEGSSGGYERKIWKGECSLDHIEYKQKPSDKDAARITNSIGDNRVALTEDELIDAIVFHGRSWSPSIFSQSKRCSETFIGMNALVLDFDKGFESLDQILERSDANNLKFSFVHESFSHTSERPKYRGVILLSGLVTDLGEAKIYLHYLKEIFAGFVDNAAAEPTRFFYGGKGLVFHNPRHYYSVARFRVNLGTDKYLEILNRLCNKGEYVIKEDVSVDFEDFESANKFLENELDGITKSQKRRLMAELIVARDAIREFKQGRNMSRYMLLFNSASALGRISNIPESLSFQILVEAAESNPYFSRQWDKDIQTVVRNAIICGRKIATDYEF